MLISQEICNQYSDQEIIRKSTSDIDYFSCVYQRYEERLLRYIKRISKVTDEEAEDILQEAFIKVWKNLNLINIDLKLSSWLYRIVHNEVISRWRKDRWSRHNPFLELNEQMLQSITDDMDIIKTSEDLLNQQISKLPEKYREVLVLKYFEDLSYEEISDILKLPEGTVAIRLNRAKKIIKSTFSEIHKTNLKAQ